ncbi:MAG TPA: nitroreductase family protein [Nocardia sp.]|uniref:nitroreductase family protein n=1 Tax=Nocardia TaxID=1817 RepID=UPI0024555F62|nr:MULTISPECIES: nitroreductase family protein [Nocardia]HLS78992.1 nitroreductase family protein [Nocardia sp.]
MSRPALGSDAPLLDIMSTMRAMRRLSPEPVPDELLTQLVRSATWAPSGSNAQGYQFVVVTDRERIAALAELWRVVADFYIAGIARAVPPGSTEEQHEKLRAALRYQRDHFHETPAVIVACYDSGPYFARLRTQARDIARATMGLGPSRVLTMTRLLRRTAEMAEAASIYPSVQNLLLTARALGLGATLTTWHLMMEPEFKKALGIPRRVHTFAIIPVGYPRGRFGPVRRHEPETVIHRDRW